MTQGRSEADASKTLTEAKKQPIAIIGIGCRFPGGANSPEAFWKLLKDGVDAVTEVPEDRQKIWGFQASDAAELGLPWPFWGGFLENVDHFDPQFFGISPRETVRMDPQHRILLEVAWEALEDGGQVPEHLAGTPVGVFLGISAADYGEVQKRAPWDTIALHSATG